VKNYEIKIAFLYFLVPIHFLCSFIPLSSYQTCDEWLEKRRGEKSSLELSTDKGNSVSNDEWLSNISEHVPARGPRLVFVYIHTP
jgi:hypothetical protein